jgi:D-aminopeptidase
VHIGALPSGAHDAITDVEGVAVGHATLHQGERLHTGVTVVLPHAGNPFARKLPAALSVQNGYGKLVGATQLMELGELESPIALCGTLNVHRVADGLLDWLLARPGNEGVRSANVVVGETNDGRLSDIRARPLGAEHVAAAIAAASRGHVEVGAVGAGAGTVCFGYKGGVGTSSRRAAGFMVGVLVQTNFGGRLVVDGAPMSALVGEDHDGSCMIVVATDAPLDQRGLERLARRAFAGMARVGASFSNGSGDYALAFSTAGFGGEPLRGGALSPLFVAVADATEQAILDSLCAARTIRGMGREAPALPLAPLWRRFQGGGR